MTGKTMPILRSRHLAAAAWVEISYPVLSPRFGVDFWGGTRGFLSPKTNNDPSMPCHAMSCDHVISVISVISISVWNLPLDMKCDLHFGSWSSIFGCSLAFRFTRGQLVGRIVEIWVARNWRVFAVIGSRCETRICELVRYELFPIWQQWKECGGCLAGTIRAFGSCRPQWGCCAQSKDLCCTWIIHGKGVMIPGYFLGLLLDYEDCVEIQPYKTGEDVAQLVTHSGLRWFHIEIVSKWASVARCRKYLGVTFWGLHPQWKIIHQKREQNMPKML